MLAEATFFGRYLTLLLGREVVLVVDARSGLSVGMSALALAACGSAQSVKLGGKLSLRLDEGSAVIAHRLVTRVGVLGEEGEARRDEEHEQEHQREGGIEYEEDDSHDTSDDGLQ